MTTATRTYIGPSAQQIAEWLSDRSIRPSDGWWRIRGVCHGGDTRPGSLTIRDRDRGGISVRCFVGCDRQAVIDALETLTGWQIRDAYDKPRGPTDPAERQRRFERQRANWHKRQQLAADAVAKARSLIDLAKFEGHPYLATKGFPEQRGLVRHGELLLPMRHIRTSALMGLQRIGADGSKKNIYGSLTKQAVMTLGPSAAQSTWYCEGYATGLSNYLKMARRHCRRNHRSAHASCNTPR